MLGHDGVCGRGGSSSGGGGGGGVTAACDIGAATVARLRSFAQRVREGRLAPRVYCRRLGYLVLGVATPAGERPANKWVLLGAYKDLDTPAGKIALLRWPGLIDIDCLSKSKLNLRILNSVVTLISTPTLTLTLPTSLTLT